MSVEYKIYDQTLIEKEEKRGKFKERLKAVLDKEFNNFLEKNEEENAVELEEMKSSLFKILNKKESKKDNSSIPVCTVTSAKIYMEIEMEEIKEMMNAENKRYIIKGEDGSVYKNFEAFKKAIDNAEKTIRE